MICPDCRNLLITGNKWMCETCRTEINPADAVSQQEIPFTNLETVNSSLLAPWYQLILAEPHPYGKVRRMIDLVRVQLISICGIMIREYSSTEHAEDSSIDFLLSEKVQLPLDSTWNTLAGKLDKYFSKQKHEISKHAKEALDFYRISESERPKGEQFRIVRGYYDEDGKWRETVSFQPLLSAFITFRNEFVHKYHISWDEASSDFKKYYPVFQVLLQNWQDSGLSLQSLANTAYPFILGDDDVISVYYKTDSDTARYISADGKEASMNKEIFLQEFTEN
ncbi:MAG: hypothetical protein ACLFR1_04410 [Spirochaetia bacterium]